MDQSTTTPTSRPTRSPSCCHSRVLAGKRFVCCSDHAARTGPMPINADAHWMVAEDRVDA